MTNEECASGPAPTLEAFKTLSATTHGSRRKRRVIQALIDAMEKHLDSLELVQKCCSGLFDYFDIPQDQDILFAYGRVARLLLKVLEKHEPYADAVISYLNSMARHVEGKHRIEMGETGAIEKMLQQIERKLQADTCDYKMDACWHFLWNVLNETPANSERFLKAEGLTLFRQCYTKFGDKNPELVRSMLGTIWVIAEISQLRDQLLTKEYLEIFCTLLDNSNDESEVSFISAGVLANLISDDGDEQAWTQLGIAQSRNHVNLLIVQAVEKWDLQKYAYLVYETLKPVIHLLTQWHAIGSQHWAVWVLANLTTTKHKQKYCRMVTEEDGMEILEQLPSDSRSTDAIRQLACTVIKNVEEWKKNAHVD